MIGLTFNQSQITGPFPTDLIVLSDLQSLNLSANSLVGVFSDELCDRSTSPNIIFINGDGGNCPNDFDSTTGEYLDGCCDNILIDVDIYLNKFATAVLGDANCNNLGGSEANVCNYMSNKANHAIFANGYPEDFPGIWDWLKVSLTVM